MVVRASSGAPCIYVVGMHRSGTSAATGSIASLGIATTRPDDLLAGGDDNRKGFFESTTLIEVDNEVLDLLRGAWHVPPLDRDVCRAVRRLGERASEAVASVFPDGAVVWKDPRVCLLLPFWRRVMTRPSGAVLVWRDPVEVAASLHARHGLGLEHGLALWHHYNRRALEGLTDMPVVVTGFVDLLDQPERFLADLAGLFRSLGLELDQREGLDALRRLLDADLRRQRSGERAAGESIDPERIRSLEPLAAVLRELSGFHSAWAVLEMPGSPQWVEDLLREELREWRRAMYGRRWSRPWRPAPEKRASVVGTARS